MLGKQHSENRLAFQKADSLDAPSFLRANTTYRTESAIRITGDSRTRGVRTTLVGRDVASGQSIAVLIRNRRRNEWQLNSTELYTLLALADEQRLARPSANSYKVQIMVVHVHWIQRLSAQIPSSFLTSIISGGRMLLGNIHIRRTPWFNFMDEQGRRGALQAMFEHFPLNTACKPPPLPLIPTAKRERNSDIDAGLIPKKQRNEHDQLRISATPSARFQDVQVPSVDLSTPRPFQYG
ncbi:hypothetical protein BKA65DRAFT_557531 [Rhexocercosporidium sp. MPI-PUGE-AT-0058]|nr:hypothetical protein BKA65DRAFT_557531 [Rhexocercosporidium sp. MPI-PUGE-AT-0058]